MDDVIIIKPLKGVILNNREIKFGMTQKDVEKELGKPAKFETNNLIDLITEPRIGTIFKYKKGKLYAIDIPLQEGLKPLYKDIDILHDKEAVAKLSEYDTPTPDNGQFMNFYKLGICLGGYGRKRIPEKKIVTVFSEDQKQRFEMRFLIGGGKL